MEDWSCSIDPVAWDPIHSRMADRDFVRSCSRQSMQWGALAATLLGSVALYAYPLVAGDVAWEFLLLWDDKDNFLQNDVVTAPLSWSSLQHMFELERVNVYEPLGWLLKAVVFHALGYHNARVVRVVTLLLHLVASALLVPLLARLLAIRYVCWHGHRAKAETMSMEAMHKQQYQRWRPWAVVTAVLFAVHPVHVEIVAWPSAQPYALAAVFANLSTLCYLENVKQRIGRSRSSSAPYASLLASAALYACAVLSKSVIILLPVVFMLLEMSFMVHMHNGSTERSLSAPSENGSNQASSNGKEDLEQVSRLLHKSKETVQRLAMHVLLLVLLLFRSLSANREGTREDADAVLLTWSERVMKLGMQPTWMIRHILWPNDVRIHYRLNESDLDWRSNPECFLSYLALVLLFLAAVERCLRDLRSLEFVVALIAFCIQLLPTSGLIQHGMVMMSANRYVYFPSTVLLPFVTYALSRMASTSRPQEDLKGWCRQGLRQLMLSLLIVGLALQSSFSMYKWRDEMTLLNHSVEQDPGDWRSYENLWKTLGDDQECQELSQCSQTLNLAYHFAPKKSLKAQVTRLTYRLAMGHRSLYCDGFSELLRHHPESAYVQNNVALCLVDRGLVELALQHLELANRVDASKAVRRTTQSNLEKLKAYMRQLKTGDSNQDTFLGTFLF